MSKMNNKHMHQVHIIWAWAFDGIRNDQVKQLIFENYIRELEYSDPLSAQELSILVYMQTPRQKTFGDQLQIPIKDETQIRI